MKRPDKSKVTITELAPDPDQILQLKDPAQLSRAVHGLTKQIGRFLAARQNKRRSIDRVLNEPSQQRAQRDKSKAFEIATRLMEQDRMLLLPRKKTELARRIRTQWKGPSKKPGVRTIRRWLAEK